jgi:hypothetical protein
MMSVRINHDHNELQLKVASGSNVRQALELAQVTLGKLDEVEPGLDTILTDGSYVNVTRVIEEFYTEQVSLPFEHQELKNEALPEGERRLSQEGANGLKEITYRRVYENGIEVANSIIKSLVIKEAVPEVEMIGSRSMSEAIGVPGKIAFLAAGNAWIIENNTADRQLVVSTGDLDGRIFSLSLDGRYLLFTRFSSSSNEINSLWAASLESDPIRIIDLGGENIVHFAEFNPASNIVAFSTSEWREASPGWQANNDLYEVEFIPSGSISSPRQDLPASSGGVYGWWGSEYAWSPDGTRFLFSRPDQVGIFDRQENTRASILDIMPYRTGGDWAWAPGIAWSPAGNVVYTVSHVANESAGSSETQEFDLTAIPLLGGSPVTLVKNVGMFAYPVTSPVSQVSTENATNTVEGLEQVEFSVAYLQALLPEQSETSTYRLFTIDRDGSNRKALFPHESDSGLSPQRVAWSPASLGEQGNYAIALVYNGNIWIIDAATGAAQQVTGDGLTTRLDWR